jgi:hypothetical protein
MLPVRRAGNLTTFIHLYVPTGLKSGSLNVLESSGPVQAYAGITLLLFQGKDLYHYDIF